MTREHAALGRPPRRAWLVVVALVASGGVWLVVAAPWRNPAAAHPTTPASSTRSAVGSTAPVVATAAPVVATTARPSHAPGAPTCSAQSPCLDPAPSPLATPSGAALARADVVVTGAWWDDQVDGAWVGAVVAGAESAGTCHLQLRLAATVVSVQVPAEPGPSSMSCAFSVPRASLVAGTWTASASYVSAARSGSATDVPITVP